MADSGSSSASEEYNGRDGEGPSLTPSPIGLRHSPAVSRPPSRPSSNRSRNYRDLPWSARTNDSIEEHAADIHRTLEARLPAPQNQKGLRIGKADYAEKNIQCVKAIRKQSKNLGMLAETGSKLTSPDDSVENPFVFPYNGTTPAVAAASAPLKLPTRHNHHRTKKSKKRNKDRSYDRDLKLLGADYERGGNVVTQGPEGFKPAFEVETSSQFLSLASRRVEKDDDRDDRDDRGATFGFRRPSLSRSASRWPNCSRERIKFYEYFSVLIELGSKAKRKREEQMRKAPTHQAPEAFRNELKDVLWLELQAWMHNQDMHHEDMYLMQERDKIDDILRNIASFRIDDPDLSVPCFSTCQEIDSKYIRILHSAYRQVGLILQKLDEVEHLYPSTSKIGLSHALYEKPQFQDKVKALIMWSNFYVQLSYRLQSVAGIICGRKTNEVFPKLPTTLSEVFTVDSGNGGDVLDGITSNMDLEGDSRSGLSSRASSYYDISHFDDDEAENFSAMQATLRMYLEKSMRKSGLEKTITSIMNLVFPTLRHILKNLEQPVTSVFMLHRQTSSPEGRGEVDIVKLWCDLHRDSNLPCLDRVFVHLLRLPIRTLTEGVSLRLEQRPAILRLDQLSDVDPDLASLNLLIHECKDTLVIAIKIRSDYIELGSTIRHHDIMLNDIRNLDDQMKKLLELYLDYLQQWILTLQKETRASRLQKTVLEDEWKSMTQLCGGIDEAELELPKMFCAIVQGLLNGIGSLLDSGLDDFISSLYHVEEGINGLSPSKDTFRQFFRDCNAVFVEARERCFKLLEFTKLLHKDLEIAAVYEISVSMPIFLDVLSTTHHWLLDLCAPDVVPKDCPKYKFFVSSSVGNNLTQITRLLNATMGDREQEADMDGYLLIVPADCTDKWNGRTVKVDTGALTVIRHSHIEFDAGSVMMVVLKNSILATQAKQFEKRLPKDYVKPAIPQTTCHQLISQDLEGIKEESLELGKKICSVILRVQEDVSVDKFPDISDPERLLLIKGSRDLLHRSYNFCIEYHRELTRLNFCDEEALAHQLFALARQWMEFVIQKCERGHGTRPRWCTPGLDYLTVAVRPSYTRYQSEDEFLSFKSLIDTCVTHVIGDQPPPGSKTPLESPTTFYLSPPQSTLSLHRSSLSFPDGNTLPLGIPSRMSSKSDTAYESSEDDDSELYEPHRRVEEAVAKLDKKRNEDLLRQKAVGMIVPTEGTKSLNHLKARKVDFRWRLCGKLGSGRHANVYKVYNLDTGGLLAVKKFYITQANYSERINKLAAETEWLAGLKHSNVVQYFGVEIHRDELLLFMEYCNGGTLSDVARQGLDLIMVRVYTKQLLMGIAYLHENAICHLDIKGQNVFLTIDGLVKLGDFSEMVKLEYGETRTNNVQANQGTPRYMSPEMIRGDDARIGRATDIWSFGCVVVEMITGKTPKFDKDDDYAIMYHVAAGGRPKIPDSLSLDAKDFLDHCFEKEPQNRWKAEELLTHSFVTVEIGVMDL